MSNSVSSLTEYLSIISFLSPVLVFLVWIFLGFRQKGDVLKKKKDTQIQMKISMVALVVLSPIALFIGGMATDAPSSTMVQFFEGFLLVESLPLLCLIIVMIKRWLQSDE